MRLRIGKFAATIAAIASVIAEVAAAAGTATAAGAGAVGSALGSAAGAVGSALGSVPGMVGGALTGSGSGLGGAIGSGALGEVGTGALGTIAPEALAGTTFAGPTAGLTAGEAALMSPASLTSPVAATAPFGGVAGLGVGPPTAEAVSAASGMPNFAGAMGSFNNFMQNPGQNIGGQIGEAFGNEQLGSQIGKTGDILMKARKPEQQQGPPMPGRPAMPGIMPPQVSGLPGVNPQAGFRVNPQTGRLEYS